MWSCVRVLALAMVIVCMLHYHYQILSIEWILDFEFNTKFHLTYLTYNKINPKSTFEVNI